MSSIVRYEATAAVNPASSPYVTVPSAVNRAGREARPASRFASSRVLALSLSPPLTTASSLLTRPPPLPPVVPLVPREHAPALVDRLGRGAQDVEPARVAHELGLLAQEAEPRVQLLALTDRDTQVALPVDHEHRRRHRRQGGEGRALHVLLE